MPDLIIAIVLVVVIGAAVLYIRRAKKSGVKCIGCPAGGECSQKSGKSSGCSCGCHADTEES